MATSTIPAAIDYLVTTTRAMPEFALPVRVHDGWPDARSDTGLVVGITPDDPTTDGEVMHAELGAQTQWEQYRIPCVAWAYRAGDKAMSHARKAAFALLDALDTHLRTPDGRTLGGLLRSATAVLGNVSIRQTGAAEEAGEGRTCEIRFDVICKSRSTA